MYITIADGTSLGVPDPLARHLIATGEAVPEGLPGPSPCPGSLGAEFASDPAEAGSPGATLP